MRELRVGRWRELRTAGRADPLASKSAFDLSAPQFVHAGKARFRAGIAPFVASLGQRL